MNKYRCNKCGQESEMIPKEHGFFENIYNTDGSPAENKKCSGEFVLIKQDAKKGRDD